MVTFPVCFLFRNFSSHASILDFQKLRNPPGRPGHCDTPQSPLHQNLPSYFWEGFCVYFPGYHRDSQHTRVAFRGKEGKERKRGWVRGREVARAKRKPGRDT